MYAGFSEKHCAEFKTKSSKPCQRRRFFPGAVLFWGLIVSRVLLHGYRELDGAELKIDLERVRVTRLQGGGDEVKLPVVTNKVEGNVGNIRSAVCVHVVHRAPHAAEHGYR